MRSIETTTQYRKDFDMAKKRHLPIDKLNAIVVKLANDVPLPPANKSGAGGKLLIYKKLQNNLTNNFY